ncbi:hypothetical protein FM110_10400 [Brachybacterium nesterenkovii]|uniref:Uncharacterized protein n=1 Tax=Brachybacterium nesterenkovii TaxID=47847 RepID=A0A1X6X699_9MICO|nr:hypothetical protein FM110_10400 [Brachybacterium nesterenkovii]
MRAGMRLRTASWSRDALVAELDMAGTSRGRGSGTAGGGGARPAQRGARAQHPLRGSRDARTGGLPTLRRGIRPTASRPVGDIRRSVMPAIP